MADFLLRYSRAKQWKEQAEELSSGCSHYSRLRVEVPCPVFIGANVVGSSQTNIGIHLKHMHAFAEFEQHLDACVGIKLAIDAAIFSDQAVGSFKETLCLTKPERTDDAARLACRRGRLLFAQYLVSKTRWGSEYP